MKLLVTLQSHCVRHEGEVYSPHLTYEAVWHRYRSVFEEVLVATRVRELDAPPTGVPKATGPGVQFFPLPDFLGPWQYVTIRRRLKAAIHEVIDQCDACMLRAPGLISMLAWKYLRQCGRPFGVEVVADPWLVFAPGSIKSIVRPYARWSSIRTLRGQCREAQTALYVTAKALQRRYPPGPNTCAIGCSDVVIDEGVIVGDLTSRLARLAGVPGRVSAGGEPVRLGFVGSFSQMYKAPDVHIRALAKCVQNGGNVALEMVGDGGHQQDMKALAAKLGVSDRVTFLGRLVGGQPVFDFLDTVDLFLNASRMEGLPRVLVEAMSRGCPAIGTDLGGIPELLEPACLVPVNDADTLARRILTFLADEQALATAARRNVQVAAGYVKSILDRRRTEHYAELRRRTEAFSRP